MSRQTLLSILAAIGLAFALVGCGDDAASDTDATGASCSCGDKVCGFDACGNSCGAMTQLELQGEAAEGISCDTHTTCDGSLGFRCESTAVGRKCARVSQYCSQGQYVSTDFDDDGVPDCDEVVFQEQTSAAFQRKSGGEERIFFQATSGSTDATKQGEPPYNRLVLEYAYDVFDASGVPSSFDLVPTASKDCKLCLRGNSFCNESACAWDYVAESGTIDFTSSGLEDGSSCGAGTGSGAACEQDNDCGEGAEVCVDGLCQATCYLQGSITGARLKQVLIAQNGDINDFPGGSGKTWCLGDYEFSVAVPPKKTAQGVCVEVGTGTNIGDNIANFSLTQCEGDGYDFSMQTELCGGGTKAIWVVATAPWCGACSSWVPKMADAYERHKDNGLQIVVVLGEDSAKNAPSVGYCAEYGEKKGVDPTRMFMDHDGRSWGTLWDHVNNYSDGGIGLPWQAVLDGESMEYVWSSTAGAGDVTSAVCGLLGEGVCDADPLIK